MTAVKKYCGQAVPIKDKPTDWPERLPFSAAAAPRLGHNDRQRWMKVHYIVMARGAGRRRHAVAAQGNLALARLTAERRCIRTK